MKFHLALFSLTLSDLERSIQVTQVFNGLYISPNLFKITTELLLMMGSKSCEVSFGTIVFDLDSDLERSNRGQAYFRGP